MDWEHCKAAFHTDGSLRDIYIKKTTLTDWNRFITFVSAHEHKYSYNGERVPLPKEAYYIFSERDCSHFLKVFIDDIQVNCHFFLEQEIELDMNPGEVQSQAKLNTIIKFISELGDHLNRDVILTEENLPTQAWFKYNSQSKTLEYENAEYWS